MKFIIEHLDPELFEWSLIEYEHISEIIGKQNLIFTSVKKDASKLEKFGKAEKRSVSELALNNLCLMNQHGSRELATSDSKKFDYFVFGGVLGDNPAKKRTDEIKKSLLKAGVQFEERNLGIKQMPTDVAVYVTKKVLDGRRLDELKFADELEIQINENESVNLHFRYVVDDNKLIISEKLVDYLRKRKEF